MTRLAWFAPWPRAAANSHPIPAPIRHGTRRTGALASTAAEHWPTLPRLWAEARHLDAIYNQRIARRCRRT